MKCFGVLSTLGVFKRMCSSGRMVHAKTAGSRARRVALARSTLPLGLALLFACASAPSQQVPSLKNHDPCLDDLECKSRACFEHRCVDACPEGACPFTVQTCVDRGEGLTPACASGCPGASAGGTPGFTCVNFKTVSCGDAGSEASCWDCEVCDYAKGEVCGPKSIRCHVPQAEGAACQTSDDCLSGRCGYNGETRPRYVCLAKPGAQCTDSTCEHCERHADGTATRTVCAPNCLVNEDCPESHHCFYIQGLPPRRCLQYCGQYDTGSCPIGFVCSRVSDPTTWDPYFCAPQ